MSVKERWRSCKKTLKGDFESNLLILITSVIFLSINLYVYKQDFLISSTHSTHKLDNRIALIPIISTSAKTLGRLVKLINTADG